VSSAHSSKTWAEASLPASDRLHATPQHDLLVTSFGSRKLGPSLWDEQDMDSEITDPEMPELVPAPRCYYAPGATLGSTAGRTSVSSADGGAEPTSTWRDIRGGLDTCWGSSALKNALDDMGDASASTAPAPGARSLRGPPLLDSSAASLGGPPNVDDCGDRTPTPTRSKGCMLGMPSC